MNKRGSHVGVILSFVIFVTFVVFLYFILSPQLNVERDKESFLDYLRFQLMEEFSTNLTSITVSIDSSTECVVLKNFLDEINVSSRLIVKDSEGDISNVYISSSDSDDLIIDRVSSSQGFFKVYYSDEFEERSSISPEGCDELIKETGYEITLIKEERYVFDTKVLDLLNEYDDEETYEDLRERLNIPEGSDFGFNFVYSDETIIKTEEKGTPGNVYAREIPVQYVDEEANVLLGKVNVKVW